MKYEPVKEQTELEKQVESAINLIMDAEQIYLCGNGGSAALADHFCTDLMKFGGIKAISLCSNTALITMIANDYGYEHVFSFQLQCLNIERGEVLICLTTSGKSENIIEAAKYAFFHGVSVISIAGGGDRSELSKYSTVFIDLSEYSNTMDIEDEQIRVAHKITRKIAKLYKEFWR